MINDYFNHIYCVNLDSRPDKWKLCEDEFAKHGLTVERVSAVNGHDLPKHPTLMPGEVGCLKSHEKILRDVVEKGYNRVLVLEDDIEFVPDVQQRFAERAKFLPENWDMLYLGGSHLNKPQMMNEWIGRISRTYTTSSYGITSLMAKVVLDGFNLRAPQVDVLYSYYHKQYMCYTFEPALAWQRAGHSDIHNIHVDYTSFMKPKDL